MKYLKQVLLTALITTNTGYLGGCAQKSTLASSPTVAENQESSEVDMLTIGEVLNQNLQEASLLVDQALNINPPSQAPQWKVSLSRHDFAKAVIETDQQKVQRRISFKTPGQYRLTVRMIAPDNSQNSSPPNIMLQRVTIIVKDQ